MEPTVLSSKELIMYGALIGAGVGVVLGLLPLILGIVKGKTKLGIIGFACSIVGGVLVASVGSVIVVAIFTWLILRKPPAANSTDAEKSTETTSS